MARYLVAAVPAQGHVTAMLGVASDLVAAGHEVVFLGGQRFRSEAEHSGARFVALPAECDWDDRDQDAAFPGRSRRPGPLKMLFDVRTAACDPLPHQARALAEIGRWFKPEAILVDCLFTGVAPLLMAGPADRPAVIACGVMPLFLSSKDTAPYGLGLEPMPGRLGRVRDAVLGILVRRVAFASLTRHANKLLAAEGIAPLPMFLLDSMTLADRILQLGAAAFEYPRRDLPAHLSFVGPVRPRIADDVDLPAWWPDVESGRPVVLATQGTLDNRDLSRLIGPTIAALAEEDVLVVVTTCGRPSSEVPGPVPANVRIASFLPYHRLMPHVAVMVSNGGYGGVQSALSQGVPVIVAGTTEDKPEVAARVSWSGAGLNLRNGTPKPAAVRAAVRRVIAEPSFRAAEGVQRDAIAALDTPALIAAALEDVVQVRRSSVM